VDTREVLGSLSACLGRADASGYALFDFRSFAMTKLKKARCQDPCSCKKILKHEKQHRTITQLLGTIETLHRHTVQPATFLLEGSTRAHTPPHAAFIYDVVRCTLHLSFSQSKQLFPILTPQIESQGVKAWKLQSSISQSKHKYS
jgi:hypothetical protein